MFVDTRVEKYQHVRQHRRMCIPHLKTTSERSEIGIGFLIENMLLTLKEEKASLIWRLVQ